MNFGLGEASRRINFRSCVLDHINDPPLYACLIFHLLLAAQLSFLHILSQSSRTHQQQRTMSSTSPSTLAAPQQQRAPPQRSGEDARVQEHDGAPRAGGAMHTPATAQKGKGKGGGNRRRARERRPKNVPSSFTNNHFFFFRINGLLHLSCSTGALNEDALGKLPATIQDMREKIRAEVRAEMRACEWPLSRFLRLCDADTQQAAHLDRAAASLLRQDEGEQRVWR
jgi:hypothetical protein